MGTGFEDLPSDRELLSAILEFLLSIYELVPAWVWGLVAVALIMMLYDRLGSRSPQEPSEYERSSRDDEHFGYTEPDRDRYTIHDDLETESREYEIPSESDDITTPNQVDRSILGTIKQLVRWVLRSGTGGDRD